MNALGEFTGDRVQSIVDGRTVAQNFIEHGVGRGHDQRVAGIDAAMKQPPLDD